MAVQYASGCKTKSKYEEEGFQVIESTDGTVSIFDQYQKPVTAHETLACCETLGYTFDIDNQKCRWASGSADLFKVVLNPQGNDSALFVVEENDECCVDVSFDYLFKFDCGVLEAASPTAVATSTTTGNVRQTKEEIQAANNLAAAIAAHAEAVAGCEAWQTRLDDEANIPYVIECADGGAVSTAGGTLTMNSSAFYSRKSAKSNLPPNAYGALNNNIITYCLTDAGLAAWESILVNESGVNGQQHWNDWLNSHGSDTSVYKCSHVQNFVESEPSPGLWHTESCDYSVFDKQQSQERITKAEGELGDCQTRITKLEDEIEDLTPAPAAADCQSYVDMFENFNVCFTLEKLNESTGQLETVYEESLLNIGTGNLYDYIDATSGNTGILIAGANSGMPPVTATAPTVPPRFGTYSFACFGVRDNLVSEVMDEYLVDNEMPTTEEGIAALNTKLTSWYESCWLQYETTICDPAVIELIQNEKINMSISIKDCCVDFSIMLDRIKLVRNCNKVDNIVTYVDEAPKFNLRRICDNKKSWISNRSKDDRDFELKYRGTEYETNHHRLVINTKEVDLNLSPARAVEQDVWCYINDNNCILEGCGDNETTYSAFTCLPSFTAETDGDTCTKITETGTTLNGSLFTVGRAFRLYTHWLYLGTTFGEDVTNKPWPISWARRGNNNTWRGPYYNVDHMVDYAGDPIIHTAFGTYYDNSGTLIYASPDAANGKFSKFGTSLAPYHSDGDPNPNILWGGGGYRYQANSGRNDNPLLADVTPITEGSDFYNDLGGGISDGGVSWAGPHVPGIAVGALMRAGVWVLPHGSSTANNQWIGFSRCLELEETKTYRFGYSADDDVRIKINGEWLVYHDAYGEGIYSPTLSGGSSGNRTGGGRSSYTVVGLTLAAGKNIIEIEGVNRGGGPVGFVAELYDASNEELMAMRYESELTAVTVWSSKDEVGNTFPLANLNGYSCPTGYALDTCLPPPYGCTKIERQLRSIVQKATIDCCCPGNVILAKNYENRTVELPLNDYSTGATLDCNDIQTLINDFSGGTIFDSVKTINCGSVLALGTGSTTEFGGYWLVNENDGTIGIYEKEWVSGSTDTYENVSDQVTSECCTIINDGFQTYADSFEQGINTYPSVSWDPSLERCVFSLCGDKGCINVDTMLTTELSEIDTVKEFETTLSSELIDVKSRQTISGYPTMRMLYDRYNMHALEYCDVQSSRFDYFDMDDFGQTVGNYWIDLIEQVVPATTIWGSTYTYKNTIFDTQKYAYKRNNTFVCDDPSEFFPWSAISKDSIVDVITETAPQTKIEVISGVTTVVEIKLNGDVRDCSTVWSMQHTCDSTFLGRVTTAENSQIQVPVDCTLSDITIETTQTEIGVFEATAYYGEPVVGPITFQWSNGQTTQTATGLSTGSYNVIVTDTGADDCTAYAEITITNGKDVCWYELPEDPQHVINETTAPILTGSDVYLQTFTMPNITVNGANIIVNYSESMSASTSSTNIDWISCPNEAVSGATTGLTYTNYVDFLNNAFRAAGVYPEYYAEIASAQTVTTPENGYINSGFYIVRPAGDEFFLGIINDGNESYDQYYSQDSFGPTLQGGNIVPFYHDVFQCEGIEVVDGQIAWDYYYVRS